MKYEDRRKNFERWNAELEALHNSNPLNRLLGPERETLVPAIDFFSSNRIEIGIVEDPATGGAAAAFAGALARFEPLGEGWSTLPILQGVEMGRPSLIGLEVNIENGALAGARIAGKAVKISEGVLFL